MAFTRVAVVLSLGCVFLAIGQPRSIAAPKKKAPKIDPALPAVEKVLRAETAGPIDRHGQLAAALKQHPDSAAARWQAGFVKDGGSWRSFDDFVRGPAAARIREEYRRHREQAAQDFAAQLNLAD